MDKNINPYPDNYTMRQLAEELLAIQHGSVEDALILAEDFPEGDDKDELVNLIEELGKED